MDIIRLKKYDSSFTLLVITWRRKLGKGYSGNGYLIIEMFNIAYKLTW